MKRKASKPRSVEQIIRILRQADGDQTVADAKRLKALEKENTELKKMLAEAMLDNRVLKEINAKKW